jgi:hypothetical protein
VLVTSSFEDYDVDASSATCRQTEDNQFSFDWAEFEGNQKQLAATPYGRCEVGARRMRFVGRTAILWSLRAAC